ncbi:MAG: 16S rRNA (guanine(966)-N(2))-methyltransferase RsmD [Bacteroidetes bacterium]|nr:16S rRNA (guanine(966)-N(2))-methyltransferase RsmD [Bacteroidota bacterium]
MRIVGGRYKGRRIQPPKSTVARPTTDFAKEGLFNILQHSVPLEGIRVLDLFAGTGSISLEFLSREAEEVISVEQDRELFAHLQRTARELNATNWHLVKSDVFTFLQGHRSTFDVVFADPPFHLEGIERIPTLVREAGLLAPDGLLIVEHPKDVDMRTDPWFDRHRPYGNVHFSFFKPTAATATDPA